MQSAGQPVKELPGFFHPRMLAIIFPQMKE